MVANIMVKVFDGERYSWMAFFYQLTTLTVGLTVFLFLILFKTTRA